MLPEVFTDSVLRQLETLTLSSRRAFLGQRQGTHLSLKRGQGIEFFDYRKYELGDNPRHIDWGLFGRSERLYVKRFREEQALSLLLLLDSSPSMAVPPLNGISKWEMASHLALSLAYVALMKQDIVYLGLTSGGVVPRYTGLAAIHRLSALLREARQQQPRDIVREVLRVASRIRFPGIALFVSDLLFPFPEIEKSINVLLAKNIDLTVIRISSALDFDPFTGAAAAIAVDSETAEQQEIDVSPTILNEYQRRVRQHLDQVKAFLSRRGVRFLEVSTEEGLDQVLAKHLLRSGVLR